MKQLSDAEVKSYNDEILNRLGETTVVLAVGVGVVLLMGSGVGEAGSGVGIVAIAIKKLLSTVSFA